MAIKIADAYVDVDLRDNTEKDLAALLARLRAANPTVHADADTDKAKRKLEVLGAEAKALGGEKVEIKADADTARARENIRGLGDEVKATESKTKGTVGRGGWIASAVGLLAAVTPQAVAAGVGIVGFAAVATPAIYKVVTAQGDLAKKWGTLDTAQKVSSAHLQALVGDYKALAKSYEPQALAAFNRAMTTGQLILKQQNPLLRTSTREVSTFLARIEDAATGGGMQHFTSFLNANMGPALRGVGDLFLTTGSLAGTLIEDLAPAGMTFLHLTTGVLGMTNALAKASPELAEMAVVGMALRAPVTGLTNMVTGASGKLKAFSASTKGATLAQKAFGLVTKAGPGLYIAAGAALIYLAARMSSVGDATDRMVDRMRSETNAFGNNISGHQQLATALQRQITTQKQLQQAAVDASTAGAEGAGLTGRTTQKVQELTKAYEAETKAVRNIQQGSAALGKEYGITAQQAQVLATAAGVDLSKGIMKGGEVTAEARAKLNAYSAAVLAAADPTKVISDAWAAAGNSALSLKDRTDALSAAMNAYFSPSLGVFQNTTKLREAFSRASEAINKSHGSLGLATVKSRAAREAFAGLLGQTAQTAQSIYALTNQQKGAAAASEASRASVQKQLPVLLALAGGSTDARNQVLALAKSFNQGATDSQILSGALGMTKKQFAAAAASAGVSKGQVGALWKQYQTLTKTLGGVAGQAGKTDGQIQQLARERALKMNIADWQAKIAKGKQQLGSVPASKRAALLANIADLERKVAAAKAKLASIHGRTVYINGVVRYTQIGATPTRMGGRIMAEGGVTGRGMVRRYAAGDLADAIPATHGIPPNITNTPIALYGESGPEAYIPLDQSRRERSTMLLSQVADMFGLALVQRMADGGIRKAASGYITVSKKSVTGTAKQRTSAGTSLIAGLTDSMLRSLDSVNTYATKVNDAIKKYFTGSTETKILSWAKGIETSMKTAATKAAAIADKIKEATDYAANVTGTAKSFASVSGLGTVGSAGDILSGLQFRSGQLSKYGSDIAALQSRGVSQGLIQQVVDLGAGQGTNLAEMLLGADQATFDAINKAQASIDAASTTIGRNAADAIYDTGKDAAKGFLTGLYGQQAELYKLMDGLAAQMAKGLAKYLGVKGTAAVAPAAKTHAAGGWGRAGELAMVGERGRELIRFGNIGGQVYTARQTEDILMGRGRRGVHIEHLNVNVAGTWDLSDPATNKRVAELLARNVREEIRQVERQYL